MFLLRRNIRTIATTAYAEPVVVHPPSVLRRAVGDIHVRAGTQLNCGGLAVVTMDFAPLPAEAATPFEFTSDLGPEELPGELAAALRTGAQETLAEGRGEDPVRVRVRLRRALVHPVDANEFRFRQAGRIAAMEALKRAGTVPPAWTRREYPPRPHALFFGGGYGGCCAVPVGDYWNFSTYWLAELWRRHDGPAPPLPYRGYELTLRLPQESGPAPAGPPGWGFQLLAYLGFFGWNAAPAVGDGRWLDLGEWINFSGHTELTGLTFVRDRLLRDTDTPNGRADFLLAVGVTAAEMAWMERDGARAVLDTLAARDPLLITDPDRLSLA